MTHDQFKQKFDALIREAMTTGEIPIATMVFCFEETKHQLINVKAAHDLRELQSKIIPATGKLPPHMPRG